MQRPSSAGTVAQGPATMKPASFDSILTASAKQLPKTAADSVKSIENELVAIRDSSRMATVFTRLSRIWQRNGQLQVSAYYMAKGAKLENSQKNLTFAAQFFLQLMEHEESPAMQHWEANEAIACLERVLKTDPANEEAQLAMATAYIEGGGEPMKGVMMLREIVKEKPDDIPANTLLGRMSIQSGQFDKAIGRFETVLKKEPENKEALYFMAQAYEGKGDKKTAIEYLEKCKKVVNNPAFSRDIDQYINSLK